MNNKATKLELKEYMEKLRPIESNPLILNYEKVVKGANVRYKVKAKKRYVPKTHYSLLARNERKFNRRGEEYIERNKFNELTEVCLIDKDHNRHFIKTQKVSIIKNIEKVKAEVCLPKSILGDANKFLTNVLRAKGISYIDVMEKLAKGKAAYDLNAKVGNFGETLSGVEIDDLPLKIIVVDKVCLDDKGNFKNYLFRNNHAFQKIKFALEEYEKAIKQRDESLK